MTAIFYFLFLLVFVSNFMYLHVTDPEKKNMHPCMQVSRRVRILPTNQNVCYSISWWSALCLYIHNKLTILCCESSFFFLGCWTYLSISPDLACPRYSYQWFVYPWLTTLHLKSWSNASLSSSICTKAVEACRSLPRPHSFSTFTYACSNTVPESASQSKQSPQVYCSRSRCGANLSGVCSKAELISSICARR